MNNEHVKGSSYIGPERRRFKRAKRDFIVFYKVVSPLEIDALVGHREAHGIMIDLCERGASILIKHNIPSTSLLSMRFILVNEKAINEEQRVRPMQVDGEVRYNILWEGVHRLGISFTETSEEDRRAIADFAKTAIAS